MSLTNPTCRLRGSVFSLFIYLSVLHLAYSSAEFDTTDEPIVRQFSIGSLDGPISYVGNVLRERKVTGGSSGGEEFEMIGGSSEQRTLRGLVYLLGMPVAVCMSEPRLFSTEIGLYEKQS
eukprot:scaffold191729_cov14-Tisochrysis_lutea.AAC.1